jgi:MSHA biogenesis protein MshI
VGRLRLTSLLGRAAAPAGTYVSETAVAIAAGVSTPASTAERPAVRCAAASVAKLDAIGAALSDLRRRAGIRPTETALVLAPEFYRIALLERPDVDDAALRDAMRWRIEDLIDFPAERAVIDVFPFPASALRGQPAKVFVVAADRQRLAPLLEQVRGAGLDPGCVDVAELSLRNLAWRLHPHPDENIAVLRITRGQGIVNVSRGHELFLSRRLTGVPTDLNDRTWDDFKDALLLQVQRSIDYYESTLAQPPADRLLVAAGGSWQGGLIAHLSEMLPVPVRSLCDAIASEYAIEHTHPTVRVLEPGAFETGDVDALTLALPALGGFTRLAETQPEAA